MSQGGIRIFNINQEEKYQLTEGDKETSDNHRDIQSDSDRQCDNLAYHRDNNNSLTLIPNIQK